MYQTKQGTNWKNMVYGRISTVLLAIFVLFLAVTAYGMYNKMEVAFHDLNVAENNLARLESRRDDMEGRIETFEEIGFEENARAKFGVVRPGEKVLILTGDGSTTSPKKEIEHRSFSEMLRSFFGK